MSLPPIPLALPRKNTECVYRQVPRWVISQRHNEKQEKSWQTLKKIQLIATDSLPLVTEASPGFNHMHYCNQPANHMLKYFIFDIITVEYPQPINNMDQARLILCFQVGPDKAIMAFVRRKKGRTDSISLSRDDQA